MVKRYQRVAVDEEGFCRFLKKGGRSHSVATDCIECVSVFEQYLQDHRKDKRLENANRKDLEAFVEWIEGNSRKSAKKYLWALRYYFAFATNVEMRRAAGEMRRQKIKKKPFELRKFRGVNQDYAERLASIGIKNAQQMLKFGKTNADRRKLSSKASVPEEAALEFVKLSDLSRIEGVKNVRARLYYDAGVDTVERMATWDPEKLCAHLIEFVKRTGFSGIAPLPKEAKNTVETAKKLPRIVEY